VHFLAGVQGAAGHGPTEGVSQGQTATSSRTAVKSGFFNAAIRTLCPFLFLPSPPSHIKTHNNTETRNTNTRIQVFHLQNQKKIPKLPPLQSLLPSPPPCPHSKPAHFGIGLLGQEEKSHRSLGKKRRVIANGHGLSPQTFVLLQSSFQKLRQQKETIGARILSVCVVCCVCVCVFAFCFNSCIFQVVCGGGGVGEGER
jgi:hypothetical protein